MGASLVASASQICEMRGPNGLGNMQGLGSRFPSRHYRRQEQNFFGQRRGPEFLISRLPETA